MNRKLTQALCLTMSTVLLTSTPAHVLAQTSDTETTALVTNETSTEITTDQEEISEGTIEDIIEDITEDIFHDITENTIEEITEDIIDDIPEGITEDIIENITEETTDITETYSSPKDDTVVYTQATSTNDNSVGDGSPGNPYNRFEDALINVADNGTIVIKDGSKAFLNVQDEQGLLPFIINKNITIRSDSDNGLATLIVRSAGLILQGNVTFKNINFAFANKYHDSIIANGYELTLIDCVSEHGSREIDLFAGTLNDKNKQPIAGVVYDDDGKKHITLPTKGSHANINITSTGKMPSSTHYAPKFGKVFAGSLNGGFDGPVTITINNDGSLKMLGIYSCGADEPEIGSMFDITEPMPPTENPNDYPIAGTVNIALNDHQVDVYGAGAKTYVTMSTSNPMANFALDKIDGLSLTNGCFTPTTISWKEPTESFLNIEGKSELNLSKISDVEVGIFESDGKITLLTDGLLTVHKKIIGTTTFQTVGGNAAGTHSGLVKPGHIYIKGAGDANAFILNPYPSQKGYILSLGEGGWSAQKGSDGIKIPEKLDKVYFENELVVCNIDDPDFAENEYAFFFTPALEEVLSEDLIGTTICNLGYNLYINGELLPMDIDKINNSNFAHVFFPMHLENSIPSSY